MPYYIEVKEADKIIFESLRCNDKKIAEENYMKFLKDISDTSKSMITLTNNNNELVSINNIKYFNSIITLKLEDC